MTTTLETTKGDHTFATTHTRTSALGSLLRTLAAPNVRDALLGAIVDAYAAGYEAGRIASADDVDDPIIDGTIYARVEIDAKAYVARLGALAQLAADDCEDAP